MIRVEYECDRCGHKQPNNEQMWDIGFGYAPHGSYLSNPYSSDKFAKPVIVNLWCRACVEACGFLVMNNKEKPVPKMTLNELFREMVREEIEDARNQ